MKKITLDDIKGLASYEKVRADFRQRIINLKKKRRVPIGDKVTLVFENRDTVIFQIQEMLRAERITDLDKVRDEIETYNSLIPEPGELSATLLLEIEDQSNMREQLLKFLGVDEAVYLKVGDKGTVRAQFEEGRSRDDKISAVQYVKFPVGEELRKGFADNKNEIKLVIEHPNYRAETRLDPETQESLAEDLEP
ncbi:MAG: DUF3501 family protein [Deltaproteobacteria bacterium]|nr:DUF3501 family protein [Deltaproteobacteria bacterium]